MMEPQRQAYRAEAYELLAELETSLLALEECPADKELIGRVFRALHTIKGSGAMFGFDDIAAFTHDVENVFDLVRNEKLGVTKTLVDLTLRAGDQIRGMLDGPDGGEMTVTSVAGEITSALRELIAKGDNQVGQVPPLTLQATEDEQVERTYRISLRLDREIFSRGANPVLLLNELRELGECSVIANTEAIPELEELDPEQCHIGWDVILTTRRGLDAIKDVFIFVEDECELAIEFIDEPGCEDDDAPPKRLGKILIERGLVTQEDLQEALGAQTRVGQLLVDKGLVEPSRVDSALAEQEHIRAVRSKHQKEEQTSSVRVPAARLDALVNLVGEMVTVQARLSQTVSSMDHAGLLSISEEVERLTAELRDNTMSIRMLPIGTTFSKFKRLVRDLSGELGKDILLVTDGGETELDKTVIERLNDPLVHLIRNCIDHGIESPGVREAAGKPRQGTVQLSAMHSGASVLIRITDDGAGLDADAIRSTALEKGLTATGTELCEKELFSLIFAPGFSTTRQITSISGRGVGMDVVKRSIDALRGSIEVSSRKGIGTTITLKLPLTLAIIDGLLVKVGDGHYVLPLSIVEECVELTREDVARAHGRHITHLRGGIVPYIRLRERFAISGNAPEVEQIVITESPGGNVGFVVDKVIGEHQTVIKNMGKIYRNVDVISGATILGDGTVALIMDVPKLVQSVEMQESLTH
ncbi:CheA signal transduction histidine kinase [Syntrophobacter sp. SbD1]|nr:CheA signal transduction histidine kinase [Syntrophobacter sp. SbD1]